MKEHTTHKYGWVMIIIAWILFIGLLTKFFHVWYVKQINPNQEFKTSWVRSGVRQVVLKPNQYHHYVFTGKVNKQKATFLIDTGATYVSIPAHLASRLGLQRGSTHKVQTANGDITVYATKIKRLEIGKIVLRNVKANINPHMDSDIILLGMSALKRVELIIRKDRLVLIKW